jgi:hypothetical protein
MTKRISVNKVMDKLKGPILKQKAKKDLKDRIRIKGHFDWFYHELKGYNDLKGKAGEVIVKMCFKQNHDVKPRTSTGHDLIIDGVNTEVKICNEIKEDTFRWLHLKLEEPEYELVILVAVRANEIKMWATTSTVLNDLRKDKTISIGLCGKKGSDDWSVTVSEEEANLWFQDISNEDLDINAFIVDQGMSDEYKRRTENIKELFA